VNEDPPTDVPPPFPKSAIVFAVVAVGALALWLFCNSNQTNAKSSNAKPEFNDPASVPELELKAERPDGTQSWAAIDVPARPQFTAELVAHGKDLFAKACAGCHGPEGKGDGPVPGRFDFVALPANLTMPADSIKIRSTMMESIPRDEDLFRTITRGMPGTAMWSYRALPAADRWALVAYVKSLSKAYAEQEPDAVPIPPKIPADADLIATGHTIFSTVCVNCHGTAGLGPVVPMNNQETGKPYSGIAWARNGGTEMLGGSSEADLARTLLTGFHRRSPMLSWRTYLYGSSDPTPAQKAEGDRKFWGLVYYCRELMKNSSK
jgi:mono/diheme cytochrome c family protein